MEWNKIEKDWKKQLDEQSIAPSAAAWDKLSQQLDKREKKKKRGVITTWIGIAACLVVGGMIGLLLLKTEPSIEFNGIDSPTVEQQLVIEEVKAEDVFSEENEVRTVDKDLSVSPRKEKERIQIQSIAQIENTTSIPTITKREKMDSLIIDEIWVKKPQRKVVVDSNNLLKQVEGEIEVEYRETKLKKIIETTRKAVVDLSDSRYEK